MKYIDADKLVAEIEKRIANCETQHPSLMGGRDFTDRENEVYCEECAYRDILEYVNSLPEEPSENIGQLDLEKAAEDAWADYEYRNGNLYSSCFKDGFKEGVQWKKAQMIKKAIGWIKWNNDNGGCLFDGWRKDFIKTMED